MAPQTTTFIAIPYEIISHIFQFLDIYSLKQSRLVSRLLEPPASTTLFSTVHIATTITSLNHATCISRSEKLSPKVKSLTYHASTLVPSAHGSLDEPTGGFSAGPRNPSEFATYLARLLSHDDAVFASTDSLALWQDYVAIWRARLDLESHGYVSQRLRALLRCFPNITTIQLTPMLPSAKYVPGEHIPYLSRVDEEAFTDVLSACYDREGIRCMRAGSLHWGSFRPCNDLSVLCGNLRELDLAIDDRNIGFPYSYMRAQFDAFLGQCGNLEALVLDFGTCPDWDGHHEDIRAASECVLGRVWRRLERARLAGFIAGESELARFLVNNAASLLSAEIQELFWDGESAILRTRLHVHGPRRFSVPVSTTSQ